jgi:hypothetical protein
MFRASKKKKRPRVIVTGDDDEDSPDETTVVVPATKKSKTSKRATSTIRSFEDEAETDNNNDRKKKKRKGMGFGGFSAALASNREEDVNDEQAQHESATHKEEQHHSSMYGKDALEQLKSEQRFKKKPVAEENCDVAGTNAQSKSREKKTDTALPSFIPLGGDDSIAEPMILTGEDAAKLEETDVIGDIAPSSALHEAVQESRAATIDANDEADWEDQIARRAGVVAPEQGQPGPPSNSAAPATSSLSDLREQVQSTLMRLKNQRDDIQSARSRREVEVQHQESEHSRQEADLQDAGKALEFYQSLRADLALWVGALRDLKTKVTPLQQALKELKQDTSTVQRWKQQQDDVVAILREAKKLDRVLGRQPETIEEPITTVDEFGRDVKSRHVLERETRARQRRRILQQRGGGRATDSDALISQGEEDKARERRTALREALRVARNELDDEYTDLSNLTALFDKWAQTYPEEYKQCFGSMSLADLANVLVQVDLCSTCHPLHWLDDHKQQVPFPWVEALKAMATGESSEESPLYRVVDSILIPSVVELLDEGAYDILSSKQSRSLSAFYRQMSSLFPQGHILTVKLTKHIVNFVQASLDSVSLPILVSGAVSQKYTADDLRESVEYATTGQLYRLEKVLTNLITYWAPVGDVAEPVLDFMSAKYLFLLSSLPRESAGPAFRALWKQLQATSWLDRPDVFLLAAPIRAAASVYAASESQ